MTTSVHDMFVHVTDFNHSPPLYGSTVEKLAKIILPDLAFIIQIKLVQFDQPLKEKKQETKVIF